MDSIRNITTAVLFSSHPMKISTAVLKKNYYIALEYFTLQCASNVEYINARLEQYRELFAVNKNECKMTDKKRFKVIRAVVNNLYAPWRRKYRYWLVCDIALIINQESEAKKVYKVLFRYLNDKQINSINALIELLHNEETIPPMFDFCSDLIKQYRENNKFEYLPEKRIMVTANMSAGKSTLINAIVGKPLTQTAQEACTGSLSYLYNKPFEDGTINLCASPIRLDVSYNDVAKVSKSELSYVSSWFRTLEQVEKRMCLIDTPGVNSAINRNHARITKEALKREQYDVLVYVLNANKLGTDDEMKYLKYVVENIPKQKVVFVLNKLDDFKDNEDSIADSISGVREDLMKIGYEDPVVCPLSAYFAWLIKMKKHGEDLTEDEQDTYNYYIKKFTKQTYDLSQHYADIPYDEQADKNELSAMGVKCGMYNFEKILFGGN